MDCLRQYACLVIKPIATYNFDTVVNCTMVGQASGSMMYRDLNIDPMYLMFVFC